MKVYLMNDDIDFHGNLCKCGKCDANGKSIGIAIRKFHCVCNGHKECYHEDMIDEDLMTDSILEMVYGPTEISAFHNAKLICIDRGYTVID